MKRILLALTAALAVATAAPAMAKEQIVIGEVSWDAARAISNVLKVVIEERLGADVKIIAADQAAIFAAMDKGDGSIDVHPDLWLPVQADRWNKFIAPGSRETVLVNDKPYTGENALYIPGYIQDEYGVRKVSDLADPKIAKLFDFDGDGKGDFWPGAPGWNGVNTQAVRARSYGFDKYFKPFVVSDAVMKAQLDKAFKQKKAFVLYYWTPEWLHSVYDLRKLEEPPFDGYAMDSKKGDPQYKADGCYKMIQPNEDPDWLKKSSIQCAEPDATVYVAYSKSLLQRAPKVAQFLKQVNFDTTEISQWLVAVARDKQDPYAFAKAWVKAHPEQVQAWLAGIQ